VLRTFVGSDAPDLSDTFNRARPVENVINPKRMAIGLVRSLRAPGADRKAILKEVWGELPLELTLRRHRLLDGFRSTRPTATERDGWSVGDPPGEPSYRPAATPSEVPTAQEPAAQEPAAQEPAAQEPAAQEPAAQEPAAQLSR
jgi:hypothetical protein